MGTNQPHGQSLMIDTLEAGLKHNASIEERSPGMKSLKSGAKSLEKNGIIEEEDDADMFDMDGNPIKKSQLGANGLPSVMSGQGLRSDQTLPNQLGEQYGSEYAQSNQPLSPSLKSLIKGKQHQAPESIRDQLKDAERLNQRKVKGASSIKGAIRSAATRD